MIRSLSKVTRVLSARQQAAAEGFSSVLSPSEQIAPSSSLSPSSFAAVGDRGLIGQTINQRAYHWASTANRAGDSDKKQWRLLARQGYDVNPCNSPYHPAVEAGIELDSDSNEISVQEAYTPDSACFGCGPAAEDGLHLRSFRVPEGLEATVTLDSKYCAFPGIINGGIVSALFDCHGNWTAAIALMDRGCLPKPLLTLTSEILVKFVEPTPPNEPLIVRSKIVRIIESGEVGQKASVEVDLTLHMRETGGEKLLAKATGLFKKLGALRAL